MTGRLQEELNLKDNACPGDPAPPAGYKGLSAFHKYWGKKPTEAWRFLIENFTEPNDIVLDPFLGSGLIAKECADLERRFVGFDINPISIELTRLYLALPDFLELKNAISRIENNIKKQINQMYVLHDQSIVTHFLWEQEKITRAWTKHGRKRQEIALTKNEAGKFENAPPYALGNVREIHLFDNSRINAKRAFTLADLFTPRALCAIDLLKQEINQSSGRTKRALMLILSSSLGQMSKMVFAVSRRGKTKGQSNERIEIGSWVIGYWRPRRHFEINAWNCFENKANKLLKAVRASGENRKMRITESITELLNGREGAFICTGDSETLLRDLPSNSIKVTLTDPPHGDRIPYLELSEIWNSVIGLDADYSGELIISNARERQKDAASYNRKLASILAECTRVLSDDGLMAVMFNARLKKHWDGLRELDRFADLEYIGSYPMEYSAGSVVQDNRKGGLKKDFVLLYGKNSSPRWKKNISVSFKSINGWSQEHPETMR